MMDAKKLQKRLRAINDAYGKAPRPKTDSVNKSPRSSRSTL